MGQYTPVVHVRDYFPLKAQRIDWFDGIGLQQGPREHHANGTIRNGKRRLTTTHFFFFDHLAVPVGRQLDDGELKNGYDDDRGEQFCCTGQTEDDGLS